MDAYVLQSMFCTRCFEPGRRPSMPPSNKIVAARVLGGDPSLGNELK